MNLSLVLSHLKYLSGTAFKSGQKKGRKKRKNHQPHENHPKHRFFKKKCPPLPLPIPPTVMMLLGFLVL